MAGDRRPAQALAMSAAILLDGADVEHLLDPEACIAALEDAFRALAAGTVAAPGLLGMHAGQGSFHVKAGVLAADRAYFAAKVNANFPGNAARGLPTIQGAVLLFDATDGTPLAVMDSIAITALRTAAASALAARHLAREDCRDLLLCGCGAQARAQLRALLRVRWPERIRVHDQDMAKAGRFAARMSEELAMPVEAAGDLAEAARSSDLVVTCTSASRFVIARDMIGPGTFIAAVGADSEAKQEIDPRLLAGCKVVTDLTDQARRIGDVHHAIDAGLMSAGDVHAELHEVVAGAKPGRESADEVVVFDSTGTGLQDVAAAIATWHAAVREGLGTPFRFSATGARQRRAVEFNE
jgi:ornithine cyclodeaminase/alanine dehydrogenase-like protein (mu-crystallin family)